jgi:hypothetical protein
MASQDSWYTAIRELWNDIVERDRLPRLMRISIAVVILAATLWSVFMFRHMFSANGKSFAPPPANNSATNQEIKKLEETAENFRSAVLARTGSTQLAVLAATVARKPFMPSDPPGRQEGFQQNVAGTPMIWVKAVIIKGGAAAAVADVDGYGEGIILKKGGSFADGKGRVVSITHDKVVVTWSGQKIDIPVDR